MGARCRPAAKAAGLPFPTDRYTVLGVGGAGLGALRRLRDAGLPGISFVAADTSGQSLSDLGLAAQVLLSGATRGLGTGGDADRGRIAAEAGAEKVLAACGSPDVVLLVAGLAGGTGGGAAPVLARRLREAGAVVLGFGIMPFCFESRSRAAAADRGLAALREACDTTVTLDNDRVLALTGEGLPLDLSLRIADDLLRQAAAGLWASAAASDRHKGPCAPRWPVRCRICPHWPMRAPCWCRSRAIGDWNWAIRPMPSTCCGTGFPQAAKFWPAPHRTQA